MKQLFSVISILLAMLAASHCFAAPALTTPSTTNVGAGMATLVLKSSATGTGYFTLLNGSSASCGSGDQVKAAQTGTGAVAPFFGSLLLTAGTDSYYTLRNLTQNTDYTVCFTAESPSGSLPNPDPVAANLTTAPARSFTDLDWNVVGSAGFSAGMASSPSLAFAPDGTPHAAYSDAGNDNKVTVMKFSDGTWSVVGDAGFSAGPASSLSLDFAPDGTPHVVYSDAANDDKATAMQFSGGAWIVVGIGGFSAGPASTTSLAFAPDGTPYVAYGGDDYTPAKTTVMKFSSGAWSVVGSAGFSSGPTGYTSLAIAPNGTPHVAYADYGNSGKATVMKFSGGAWVPVGNPGFSPFDVGFTSLAIAQDGTPHVAYSDYGTNGNATVMKYSGGAWNLVGSAGFSSGTANATSLAIAPDGTPCVAYHDAGGSGKTTVMQYRSGAWSLVGSAEFSAGAVDATALAFAPDGTPHVAYGDEANGSRATVMRLRNPLAISGTPAATAILGAAYSFTPTAAHADSFTITGTLPPGIDFNPSTGGLSGIPVTIGFYGNIVITASNSLGSASLPAFSITVSNSSVPDTSITTYPANPSSSPSFSFTFTSTDSGSTFECSLNGGIFGTCSSPYANSIVYAACTTCRTDTAQSFAVRAKAPGGSTDPTPAEYAWTVTNPVGTLFDNVLDGGVVQLIATDHIGDLNLNRGVACTLRGGYDAGFSTNSSVSTIVGTVTISDGTVTIENIAIK